MLLTDRINSQLINLIDKLAATSAGVAKKRDGNDEKYYKENEQQNEHWQRQRYHVLRNRDHVGHVYHHTQYPTHFHSIQLYSTSQQQMITKNK